MKTTKICLLLTLVFCSGNHLFGQPGESDKKYNIHEIKLYEGEDGSKAGALAWTTASPDGVQKFVIRNLGIMEPVQVLLQTLSPDDEVTLQFVKEKWDEPESSISAKGKTIGKKIFRTYKTAAMKISAKKAGIPYMILVQVGKKLPVNSAPLFRITNNKDEYENHLKNMGETRKNKPDPDVAMIPVTNNVNGGGSSSNNSSLLYIIIGLLALMVLLLGYFIFVKKGSKKILFLLLFFGFGFNTSFAQSSDDPAPVDFGALLVSKSEFNALVNELRTTNNLQYSNIDDNYRLIDQNRDKIQAVKDYVNAHFEANNNNWNEQSNINQIAADRFNDLQDEFNQFRNDFVDLEGDLNEINAKLSSLEAQVEFLSARDRNYAPEDQHEEGIRLTYGCPTALDLEQMKRCTRALSRRYHEYLEKFRELNRIMKHNNWVVETGIATGNALANSAPGIGLGWPKQLAGTREAQRKLYRTYNDKYDEFEAMIDIYTDRYENCYTEYGCSLEIDGEMVSRTGSTGDGITIGVYIYNKLMDRVEMSTPRIVTPTY